MDLSCDLPDLMDSLTDYEVYIYKKGWYLDDDDFPVTDIISHGLNELITGRTNPLTDYNTAFANLQARRRLTPLVGATTESRPTALHVATPPITANSPAMQNDLRSDDFVGQNDKSGTDKLEDDSDSDSDDADEEMGEFLRGFECETEETLPLETAADVSLDMDSEDLGELEELEGAEEDSDQEQSGEE